MVPRAVQPLNVDAPRDAEVSTSQEGRLYVHNVVQVWWMLIRQLVHVAYGRIVCQSLINSVRLLYNEHFDSLNAVDNVRGCCQ